MISVIIPCYNVEKYVEECVRSVMNQTYSDLEIILVDDGSTDGTPEILDKLAKEDNRIIVLHKKNEGVSQARNDALAKCSGDYISLIDGDDTVESDYFEILLHTLCTYDVDLVGCSLYKNNIETGEYELFPAVQNVTIFNGSKPYIQKCYDDDIFRISQVVSWAKLGKREIYKEKKWPKGIICEDTWSMVDMYELCSKIVVIPDCLYFYRQRQGSIMHKKGELLSYSDIAWKIHHIEYWDIHGEDALSYQLRRIVLHDIYRDYKIFTKEHKSFLKKIYKQTWKKLMKDPRMPLKSKIKYLSFGAPIFLH